MNDFTADELETIKKLIEDWGFDYALKANRAKVVELARKLGMDKLAEDIAA